MSTSNLLEGDQAIDILAARVSGSVYRPGDAGYAEEIAGFNTAIVHSPEIVVAVRSAEDVAAAIRYAGQHGLAVTVQATGHGAYKPITSGLMISTRHLNSVVIDAENKTATIGGGTTWAPVVAAAHEHGLAPVTGSSCTVGVVGFLLGGGIGPLARSHGFGSDYLLNLKVVTGEGGIVQASREENPDLFWALRGGKKGLGIVTEVEIRLVELPSLYAGCLFFAEEHIEAALRTWVTWTADAPSDVTTSVVVLNFPPLEFVPPPFRGRRLLSLRFAYPGDTETGEELAAPLRAAAPIYMDLLGPMPASQVAKIHCDPENPAPSWVHGMLLSHIDQDTATAFLGHVGPGANAPFLAAELRHIGSASSVDTSDGSAVGGRGARYTAAFIGVRPDLFATEMPTHADAIRSSLAAWISEENNINFLGEHRSEELIGTSWPPETAARLAEVRRKYDPSGVFN